MFNPALRRRFFADELLQSRGDLGNGFLTSPYLPPLPPPSVDKRHTLCSNLTMATYDFNSEKNRRLKEARGIGFEEIIARIEAGYLLATTLHPNPERYPQQWVYHVQVDGYIYLVPWVQNGETIFLKTIFPSRKATRNHKKGTFP